MEKRFYSLFVRPPFGGPSYEVYRNENTFGAFINAQALLCNGLVSKIEISEGYYPEGSEINVVEDFTNWMNGNGTGLFKQTALR